MSSRKRDVEKQAKKLFGIMFPDEPWQYASHPAKPLIRAAFGLYNAEWPQCNIVMWQWPFDIIERGATFTGDQPWSVLLRRAAELRP